MKVSEEIISVHDKMIHSFIFVDVLHCHWFIWLTGTWFISNHIGIDFQVSQYHFLSMIGVDRDVIIVMEFSKWQL